MSEFSDKLKLYLKQNGHTTASFSKSCNIDRTLLHKYGTGDRLPHNLETVTIIADKLLLSIQDKNDLIRLWNMERIGLDTYLQREGIKDLLENLDEYTSFHMNPAAFTVNCDLNSMKNIQIAKSELELQTYIRNIFRYESTKEKFHIHMCVQPIYNFLLKTLLEYSELPSISVTQLVCFYQQKSSIEKNIRFIKQILSLAFCLPNYEAKVYYDHAEHHINQMSILPNMIITDEFVILFSYDGKEGIIYREKEIHEFYTNLYHTMSARCKCISTNCTTLEEYMDMIFNKNFRYFLNQNPCFGIGFTKKFLDDILTKEIPLRESFIEKIMGDLTRRLPGYQKNNCFAFFTRSGVQNFIHTGRDNEFPPELYRPLNTEESKKLIRRTCENSNYTNLHNYLIGDTKFRYLSDVIIHIEIGGLVLFQKPAGQFQRKFVVLDESSINEMFVDFFASMEEMELVKSKEVTMDYLKKLL